jgi:hypothetical protein
MAVKVTAFGELKSISEWSRDNKCKVSYDVLRNRLAKGWNVELALATEMKLKNRDLKGERFGKLVVLQVVDNSKKRFWMCRCDCGNIITVLRYYLTHARHIKSCGCLTRIPPEIIRKRLSEIEQCPFCGGCFKPWRLDKRNAFHRKTYCRPTCASKQMHATRSWWGKTSGAKIIAFGEAKTCQQWALDDRCQVGENVIRNRIKRGLSPEAAVSFPSRIRKSSRIKNSKIVVERIMVDALKEGLKGIL